MMDIDWAATWHQNLITDYRQTCYFAKQGIEELNPLWREMVERRDYTLLAASWAICAAAFDGLARRNPSLYRVAGAVQLIVTGLNARNHRVGLPVLVVRF